MIIIALFIIFGIIMVSYAWAEFVSNIFDAILLVFLGLLLIGLLTTIGAAAAFAIGGTIAPKEYVMYTKVDLVALRDSNGIQRQFYINQGYVSSGLQYSFYEKTDNNAYIGQTLFASDNVRIYEDEQKNPYLIQYNQQLQRNAWLYAFNPSTNPKYELHIPKGSIVSGIKLDLEQ